MSEEVKYVIMGHATKEGMWMSYLFHNLHLALSGPLGISACRNRGQPAVPRCSCSAQPLNHDVEDPADEAATSDEDEEVVQDEEDRKGIDIPKERAIMIIKKWMKPVAKSLIMLGVGDGPATPMFKGKPGQLFWGTDRNALKTIVTFTCKFIGPNAATKHNNIQLDVGVESTLRINVLLKKLLDTWDLSRSNVGVIASSKGEFYGDLEIVSTHDSTIVGNHMFATTHALTQHARGFTLRSTEPGTGIIITGRGTPDFASCSLAVRIKKKKLSIVALGLFDCDAGGIVMMNTYKLHQFKALALGSLLWGGILPSELFQLQHTQPMIPCDINTLKNIVANRIPEGMEDVRQAHLK
ncbi:hypothetical protein BDV93DRAFT_511873 [Ceratobasidium sp. AG-I]|nr:hypothetical protein BDV93DRAFT_511873 [Ceratobasidium sp. AG-I]